MHDILKIFVEILKPKTLIVTQIGATIVIIEILLRLFSVETSNYFIFSGNIHWLIIFSLVVLNIELGGLKKDREIESIESGFLENLLKSFANILITLLSFGLIIILYSTLGTPSGEILFQEGDKVLIQDGHIFRVVSENSFYMYKHYRYILGLGLLLIIYFGALLPLAKEIKERE